MTSFRAPEPKGPRVRRESIPKSVQYVAPEVDPDEEAAFATEGTRTERVPGRRTALAGRGGLTAAQMRMRGVREPVDDDEEEEGGEGEDEGTEIEEPLPFVPPAVAPRVTRGPQPSAMIPASPFTSTTVQANAAGQLRTAPIASRSVPALLVRPIVVEDADRLWDWIRHDPDQGAGFLGKVFATSILLHDFMRILVNAETSGLAIIRAIHHGPHHLGFAMLAPILADERTALMHIYLRQDVRGQLAQFTGPLVEIAEQIVPGVHLAVASPDKAWQRLHRSILVPLGFTEHAMFVK